MSNHQSSVLSNSVSREQGLSHRPQVGHGRRGSKYSGINCRCGVGEAAASPHRGYEPGRIGRSRITADGRYGPRATSSDHRYEPNPDNAGNTRTTLRDVETAARSIGLQIQVLNASSVGEIDTAFASLARARADAVFVGGDTFFNSRRLQFALLAVRHGLPASYANRDYPIAGGLTSYGSNVTDYFRQVGVYAGRILKGAKPADLPVMQSSKLELVINAQAARVIGLTVSDKLLVAADEVIE